jgi:protocatechuate 3,4-dioxygenase beta subunit
MNQTKPIRPYRRYYPGTQPEYLHSPYVSSQKRAPSQPLIHLPHTLSEITGPVFTSDRIDPKAFDLTRQHSAEPLGERIIVSGRVIDEDGRPLPHTLVEIWQANSAGRYAHPIDQHDAPLDPNFTGCGHTVTAAEGRYRFVTIKPGAYPWQNHHNAWRAAHIHFSVFGPAFATRLITQMYFPGDPLMTNDPIFNCTADEDARNRLISLFDWQTTMPLHALGYQFDIVMSGRDATPFEENHGAHR